MKKIEYYFETSVFNFRFAEDDVIKRGITERLFKEWQSLNGEMFISEIVIDEIERSPEPRRSQLYDLIREFRPILLYIDDEVQELAKKYVSQGIIPRKYENDARHIAVAVVNDLNVLISWNLEHIVKLKTRLQVNGLNKILGYKEIEISTPEEVL